ncbi:MAG: GlsB/YeaQ/YmgE family stress response membrane protein [Chloroflexota bacterium]|nr:GlsB/YeaQ/YmgE family stress response membrane protein [Chloroflexota bacterium]
MGPIGWIFVGLLAGALAGFLVPGRERFGCIGTTLIGIVGGLLGGWLWVNVLDQDPATGFLGALFVAVLGSALVLVVLRLVARR